MTKDLFVTIRDAIDSAGITKYQLQFNNSYFINVGGSDQVIEFDDDNECVYYFRVNNIATTMGAKPIALECVTYDLLERVIIPSIYTEAMDLVSALGLTLTDEATDWVKEKSSINGLHPIQSTPRYDQDGNPVIYEGRPTIH